MAMIKGITVVLVTKVKAGTDEFNAPVYEQKEEEIHNVLVAPASSDDIVTAQDLYGKKAVYTLAIPKSDKHDWKDCDVRFFGETWHTVGFPVQGIAENIPLDWNKKVTVERYE
jgi:hypothetical protein